MATRGQVDAAESGAGDHVPVMSAERGFETQCLVEERVDERGLLPESGLHCGMGGQEAGGVRDQARGLFAARADELEQDECRDVLGQFSVIAGVCEDAQ